MLVEIGVLKLIDLGYVEWYHTDTSVNITTKTICI